MRYGAGRANKILEAMACATPVVTVPEALTALNAKAGRDLLVGSNATGLSEAITDLLGDQNRRESNRRRRISYVTVHHDASYRHQIAQRISMT